MSNYGGVRCPTSFMSIVLRGKSPCTCLECDIPSKRRGVGPELDTVMTVSVLALLCDQNDFMRV